MQKKEICTLKKILSSGCATYTPLLFAFLALIVGVSTSILISNFLNKKELQLIENELELETSYATSIFKNELTHRVDALERMALRFNSSPKRHKANWIKDANNYLQHFGGFQAIEWADKTSKIRWVLPLEKNKLDQDTILNKDAILADTMEYIDSNKKSAITRVIKLKQGSLGFLSIHPTPYINNKKNGYIIGVYKIEDIVSKLIDERFNIKINLNNDVMFKQHFDEQLSTLSNTHNFHLLNQSFKVEVKPKHYKAQLARLNIWSSIYLFISLLISTFIYFYTKAKLKAKKNDERYKTISDSINTTASISETDTDGVITNVNDKFLEISGYTKKELIGKKHNILKSNFHPPQFYKDIWETITSGKIWQGDICNKTKDGDIYWASSTIYPQFDPRGNVSGYTSIKYDISKRKKLELEIKSSNEEKEVINKLLEIDRSKNASLQHKLSLAMDYMLDIPWLKILKKGGVFLSVEQELRLHVSKNLGQQIESKCSKVKKGQCLCGRAFQQKKIIHASCIDNRHETTFEGISPHGHYNIPICQKNTVIGVIVLYLAHGHKKNDREVAFLKSCSEVFSLIITSHKNEVELEEQRKLSQHQSKLASIGELAAGVGHEINNPLSIIKGYIPILSKKIRDNTPSHYEEYSDYFNKISVAASRIENITKGLRSFSRADSEEKDHFEVIKAIKESIDMIKEIYQKEGVQLNMSSDEVNQRTFIYGNRGKLQQIIINLISNAKDAVSKSDKKEIYLSTSLDRGNIIIEVKDTGCGMSEETQERIFDPFFTTKAVNLGTGMGLSLAHSFIKEMNGSIKVASKLGSGSSFTVEIPAIVNNKSILSLVDNKKSQPIPEVVEKKLTCTALVVDDEEEIRYIIKNILEDLEINVYCAENGKQANELLLENGEKYDIIITDMKMPVMDGPELIKSIRQNNSITKQPKIIVVTGGINIDFEDRGNEIRKLIDGYIFKPFDEDTIKKAIHQVLNNKFTA